jgi:RNA recognition motif-containing protein
MNIYVGNLSWQTTESELKELFAAYGAVESATIIKDKNSGRSRGFGFVEMPNDAEGQAAIQALNGTDFGGRNLNVNVAKPREQGNRGGYGRGGGQQRGRDRDSNRRDRW